MNNKCIITVASTGEGPTKEMNPATPITPAEIAESVHEAYEAGAAIAHVHVRNDSGNPTMDTDKFIETCYRIREKCDIVLNLTTAGDVDASEQLRMAHLPAIKPEMATFDCGTMNWAYKELLLNTPQFHEELGPLQQSLGIVPEVEIFDIGMIDNAIHYMDVGILPKPAHFSLIFGTKGGMPATIECLEYVVRLLPKDSTWSAFGVGKNHLPILGASIIMGGGVRVGFEDNIYYARGRLAKSNAELVERAVRLCGEFQREVATSDDVREMFQLKNHYRIDQ